MSATGRKVISGCTSSAVSEVFSRPSLVSCWQEPQNKLTDSAINYQPIPHLESCFNKVKVQQMQAALGLKDEKQFPLASQHLPDKALRGQIKPTRGLLSNQNTATAHPAALPLSSPSLAQLHTCWLSGSVHLCSPWFCFVPQGVSCYPCLLHQWLWSGLLYTSWLLQLCCLESPKRKQKEWTDFPGRRFPQ